MNVTYNCVDRHLSGWRRTKAAIVWEGEPGDSRVMTYQDLYREICQFSNVLKGQGVGRGERVTLYMPMIRHRHAGLRPHRCDPQRCVWRFLCGGAA